MTEEEKNKQAQQPETHQPQPTPQPENPNIVYRPIEVEVNLLRRKIDRLIFLALIVAIAGCGMLGMKWNNQKKQSTKLALDMDKLRQEAQGILQRAQGQGQYLAMIIRELNELKKDNLAVAELCKKLNIPATSALGQAGAVATASDTTTEPPPEQP